MIVVYERLAYEKNIKVADEVHTPYIRLLTKLAVCTISVLNAALIESLYTSSLDHIAKRQC